MEMQILIIPNISCAREWNEGSTEGRKEGGGKKDTSEGGPMSHFTDPV